MTFGKSSVSFILVFVLASQAVAQVDISGTWQARYMFADITVHVENMNGALSGVLIVHEAQGDVVYHFTGTLKENAIQASHADGHSFTGHITPDARIVGTLTTSSNITIPLSVTRTSQ
jgi:hypothetical protein